MAPSRPFTYCEGAPSWNPSTYAADTALHDRAEALLAQDNLQAAITTSFSLPPPRRDPYVYHAIVSVTLPEVQHVVSLGGQNGLHSWYRGPPPSTDATSTTANSSSDKPTAPSPVVLPPPPRQDTEAYLSIFDPSTSTPAALKTFLSNAKKGSLRAEIAAYLNAKRYLHPSLATQLTIPKRAAAKKKKKASASDNNNNNNNNNNNAGNKNNNVNDNDLPPNPYLPFLFWSARNLEWAGPSPSSARAGPVMSHHVLPILMHHFGCACPSHEALSILRALAAGRGVVDMGSGGGYWSFMLRGYGVRCTAVDSAQSEWRVNWVSDTVIADGAEWLRKRRRVRAAAAAVGAGKKDGSEVDPDEAVLLLVYPIVGGGVAGGREGDFTRSMMAAYGGDTLAVVGTQNRNGYTGFRGMSMDEYVEREHGGEDGWVKVVQVALPSFPGKDEALFVFQRGPRAPAREEKDASGSSSSSTAAAVAGEVSSTKDDGSSSSSNKGAA